MQRGLSVGVAGGYAAGEEGFDGVGVFHFGNNPVGDS